MTNTDLILALDPSSSVVGYALATFDERLIDAGRITPAGKVKDFQLRTDSLVADLVDLALERRPSVVLFEIPAGRVHSGGGRRPGLSVYGFAVGRLYEAVIRSLPDTRVVAITEEQWITEPDKSKRAMVVAAKWPQISLARDTGLDTADAAGLLLWWLQRQRKAAMLSI